MLEVGKTYKHENGIDLYEITDICTDFFVGRAKDGHMEWLFDASGKAIACFGTSIKPKFRIVPAPQKETIHLRINGTTWGGVSFSKTPNDGWAVANVELTLEDGILVDAKLTKSNTKDFEFTIDKLLEIEAK